VAPQVMTPDKKGTLQQDMISASRRNGLMAVQIEGLETLLAEISHGHPVIVFENLSTKWLPKWHYAIVYGYDLDQQTVTMHSGPEREKVWNIKKFERSWMLGDYWGLVVMPPDEVAFNAGELANLVAAAGLEQAGNTDQAQQAYEAILTVWPKSLGALIGLGNIAYAREDYHLAVFYLKRAQRYHPESLAASHNLKVAAKAANIKLAVQ
ncbi:MAG: PA2778 family cysteine peptidase, partial [Bdellovibrionota bacterium]